MSPKQHAFLQALAWSIVGGMVQAVLVYLAIPASWAWSHDTLPRLLVVAGLGGAGYGVAYLKHSPWPRAEWSEEERAARVVESSDPPQENP